MADLYLEQGKGVQPTVKTKYLDKATHHELVVASDIVGPVDSLTGALEAIQYPHHEIHAGKYFAVSYKTPDASPLADNGTIIYALTPPSGVYPHIVAESACGGDAQLELYEGSTVTGGSLAAPVNHNRNSVRATTVVVLRNPTVSALGTLLDIVFMPGGTGGNSIGSSQGSRHEWILKPGLTYVVRLTNRAGNAQPAYLAVEWYEESQPGG